MKRETVGSWKIEDAKGVRNFCCLYKDGTVEIPRKATPKQLREIVNFLAAGWLMADGHLDSYHEEAQLNANASPSESKNVAKTDAEWLAETVGADG